MVTAGAWLLLFGNAVLTSASLSLLPARSDQLWQLKLLFRSAAEVTQWGGEGFRFPLQQQQFLQQLQLSDTQAYLLVNADKQPVAFGQICDRFHKIHLARLLVFPQFRGQGLSKQLITALIGQGLQDWPEREASLYVYRNNHIAIASYQKLGFTPAPQPATPRTDLHFMTLNNQHCRVLTTQCYDQQKSGVL